MKLLKLSSLAFAALLSVSAHAQIITNYGQSTYPGSPWNGNWSGAGTDIAAGNWYAQTFIAPTTAAVFAYNIQFNVLNGATPSFTTSIYTWTGTTLGTLVDFTSASFAYTNDSGFSPVGANVITNPGIGSTALDAGQVYALVIHRTDAGTSGIAQVGSANYNPLSPGIAYAGGSAFVSGNGSTFFDLGSTDFAFWVSFESDVLSPTVPEPAVNGAIIGALFVTGLFVWRRYGKKGAASAPVATA
ncbi:hypothetical protein [Rariglobus hedericola]|uniref:PEP-CTERM sorting domain-containing protein n=1 Tax=Rariglobus hedericola TaxID=2597822 RepID=A0A556QKR4_9BACT|nr:hypothetical protein [Rariglobus hedericola]TSJ77211.1 hypothetical protein FPL22_14020 [Rariglobus hedericola]